MATITSVTDGGTYHWDDPNAWVGGVVPTGSGDIAQIRHTVATHINSGSGYSYWEGVRNHITVDSTSAFPDTSGSFFTWISPVMKIVQITYDSKSGNNLQFCKISQSFQEWEGGRVGMTESGSNVGFIPNDAPVFTSPTQIYLSGSSTWHISRIIVENQGQFIVKDNAHLRLDSTTNASYVELEDGVFNMLGNVTASLAGTGERNSGLVHHDSVNYASCIISGSSDLRTRTHLTSNLPINVGTLNVADSSDFAEGDWISVYHTDSRETRMTKDNLYNYHSEYYRYHSSGSMFPAGGRKIKIKNNKLLDENESLVVSGTATGKLFVYQMFAKEGQVFATTSFDRAKFLRDRGNVGSFTGNKTEIRVKSSHNTFKEGETIVTSTGKAYRILKAQDILVPYKTVDFANGDNLHDNFDVDNFVGSGSSTQFKINSDLDIVSGSFGLTISGSTYGTNNYRKTFLLKNTKLRDYKITLSGSIIRPYDGNVNTNRRVAIIGAADPYTTPTRDRDIYGSQGTDRYTYTTINGDTLRGANYPWGYSQIDVDNINNSAVVDGVTSSRTAAFTLIQDCLREQENHFYNGVLFANTIKNRKEGAIGFRLRRENAIIKSFKVEQYAQRLLLDTSDAVPVGTEIHEGATLNPHTAEQKVVKIASSIKDLRGYKNMVASYYYAKPVSGSSVISYPNMDVANTITPKIFDNNGNKTLYLTSDTGDRRNQPNYLFTKTNRDDNYYRLNSNAAGSYFTLNLGTDVTFDAFSIQMYYDNGTGVTLGAIGLLVSNDGHTFTEIRAAATDTRISYMQPSNRIFHLGQTVTARFVRVSLSGTSSSGNNYVTQFGLHYFNGRGNSIELNNASDIGVGDFIQFINPQGEVGTDYRRQRHNNYRSRAQAGTDTETNCIGGVNPYYTVTAKTGNVITVNKDISTILWDDSLVVKINRGLTVKSESFIPFGLHYASGIDEQRRYEYANIAVLSMGGDTRERGYWYHYPDGAKNDVLNCSFTSIENSSMYMQAGGMQWLNNLFLGQTVQYFTYNRDNSDSVVSGNIVDAGSGDYAGIRTSVGQNNIHTGNILLSRRYFWVDQHSGADYSNIGIAITKGNYFRGHDYYALYVAYQHSGQFLDQYQYYANKINTRAAGGIYYRTFPPVATRPYQSRYSWEFPDQYPLVSQGPSGYGSSNLDNIQPYVSVGTDRHSSIPFYNHSKMDGKSYLEDGGRKKIIQNHANRNLYDIYAIHFNRIAPVLLSCNFNNFVQQAVRVQIKIKYKVDPTVALNTRSTNHDDMVLIVFDNFGKVVPGSRAVLPFHETLTEFSYDKTFTIPAGTYSIMITNRKDGFYNMRVMTFENMSCTVAGANPRLLEISHNGFLEYLLLKDPSKATFGYLMKGELNPIVNNPTKTTIRFRKIRF